MKKYSFIFSCEASAIAATCGEAREKAALSINHLTPYDMDYRLVTVTDYQKPEVIKHAITTHAQAVADYYGEKEKTADEDGFEFRHCDAGDRD
jgi:hypothetical protein